MKTTKIFIIAVILIIIAGLAYYFLDGAYYLFADKTVEKGEQVNEEKENKEPLIGGEKDEYGCLGPAGYTWSEEARACLREWEIKNNESKQAIKIAVEHLGWEENATVIEVIQMRCVGCFSVKLENNSTHDRKTVNIDNWEVKKISLTPDECKELGGEPLNIVGGADCAEGEESIGEVTGFISPNICCVPKKNNGVVPGLIEEVLE